MYTRREAMCAAESAGLVVCVDETKNFVMSAWLTTALLIIMYASLTTFTKASLIWIGCCETADDDMSVAHLRISSPAYMNVSSFFFGCFADDDVAFFLGGFADDDVWRSLCISTSESSPDSSSRSSSRSVRFFALFGPDNVVRVAWLTGGCRWTCPADAADAATAV